MCKMVFESDRDASMRLSGSIVTYEGEPVLVSEVTTNMATITKLGEEDWFTVQTKSLDLTPLPVGNVIVGSSYVSVQRAPVRMWKQGVERGNLNYGDMPWNVRADVRLNSVQMKNAIINSYPSFAEAVDLVLTGRRTAVPFSRHWGVGLIDEVPHLVYKDKPVGVCGKDITIFKKFFFFKENLLGVLNGTSS